MLSKERTKDCNADDRVEDGYMDTLIPKKNQTPIDKGYASDYPSPSKPSSSRMPLQSPITSKILRKTKMSINGNPFYIEFNQNVISTSRTTVELSDGKIIRKSDIVVPKSNSSNIRSFKGNISLSYFLNPNVEVGPRCTKLQKSNKQKKFNRRPGLK